ncbi:MAG: hypothetical protein D6815_06785 [Candidatus Dadabacteria bacterium]|nr:MAG: hypothetical protein D6815_06785 [Candidatus Dadabacteria bacterium]
MHLAAKLRRSLLLGSSCIASLFLAILIVEVAYRLQIIDTYRQELHAYNHEEDLSRQSTRPTLLIMGDSFSAGNESYPTILRNQLPQYRVVNAAIPGTGIVQALAVAPRRFAQFEPSVFLYQVYVGNDLYDIRYPVRWGRIPFARNLYWMLSNHLRVVQFINYRLAGTVPRFSRDNYVPTTFEAAAQRPCDAPFEPELYDWRVRMLLAAEPSAFEDYVLGIGQRGADLNTLARGVRRLMSFCKAPECRAYLLVIPHASQIGGSYLDNFRALGVQFRNLDDYLADTYPFLSALQTAVAGQKNVSVLSALPLFRDLERAGAHPYYRYDMHLTPFGQEALGNWLCGKIAGLQ